MSIKKLSPQTVDFLALVADTLGSQPLHITPAYVCDHCQNESKKAFPYGVYSKDGRFWGDLCNDCFDLLGCSCEYEGGGDGH